QGGARPNGRGRRRRRRGRRRRAGAGTQGRPGADRKVSGTRRRRFRNSSGRRDRFAGGSSGAAIEIVEIPMSESSGGAVRGGMIDMESNTPLVQCYPAHEAVPAGGGPFPPLLVLHDRFGLNPHTRNLTNRFARAGFYALAPDLYCAPSRFSLEASDSF